MKSFVLSVHDVCPRFLIELKLLRDMLPAEIKSAWSLACIAKPMGQGWNASSKRKLAELGGENVLHGYLHANTSYRLRNILSAGNDEFGGLAKADALAKVQLAREAFPHCQGWLAPTWNSGPLTKQDLFREGFAWQVGYRALWFSTVERRLATYSWDWGRLSFAGPLLNRFQPTVRKLAHANKSGGTPVVPVITIHPRDFKSGDLKQGIELVSELLDAGYTPATFGALV